MVFRKDPCGFTCLLMTYGAVAYADYVVTRWILFQTMWDSHWCFINLVAFNTIVVLLFVSHARAVFSDPGIVPLPAHPIDFSDVHIQDGKHPTLPPPDEDWTICVRCEMYRPPRAHHCRICQRCIRRMDHHCPWINNCVGERNQKYFLQFLFYVGLLSIYSIILVVISWYISNPTSGDLRNGGSHSPQHHQSASESIKSSREAMFTKQARILHSVILVLESVLFGLFVIAIGCDQFDAIFSDETLVEQAKRQGPFRPKKPKMALLAEVCGRGKHPVTWLLPCQNGTKRIEPHSVNCAV